MLHRCHSNHIPVINNHILIRVTHNLHEESHFFVRHRSIAACLALHHPRKGIQLLLTMICVLLLGAALFAKYSGKKNENAHIQFRPRHP